MKKIKNLGINFRSAQHLTREQMKKVMGGVTGTTKLCEAKADCGTNGSVSCTGYTGGGSSGCTATDDKGVGCPDQSGTMQWYPCSPA